MVFIRELDDDREKMRELALQTNWDRGFDAGYAAAKAEAWIEKAQAWDEGFHAHEVGEFLTDNPWRKKASGE